MAFFNMFSIQGKIPNVIYSSKKDLYCRYFNRNYNQHQDRNWKLKDHNTRRDADATVQSLIIYLLL